MSACKLSLGFSASDDSDVIEPLETLAFEGTLAQSPTSGLPHLPNEIHQKFITHLSLQHLFAYRRISTFYYECCVSEIYERYVKKSFALLGVYICPHRIHQPLLHELPNPHQWYASVYLKQHTITWSGKAEIPSAPIEGLFLWIFIPEYQFRFVFACYPQCCVSDHQSSSFRMTADVRFEGDSEAHQVLLLCHKYGRGFWEKRLRRYAGDPRNSPGINWEEANFIASECKGDEKAIFKYNKDLSTWQLCMPLYVFISLLAEERRFSPLWYW